MTSLKTKWQRLKYWQKGAFIGIGASLVMPIYNFLGRIGIFNNFHDIFFILVSPLVALDAVIGWFPWKFCDTFCPELHYVIFAWTLYISFYLFIGFIVGALIGLIVGKVKGG